MKIEIFVLLTSVFILVSSSPSDWFRFKRDYKKEYASASEEAMRKEIFLKNVKQMHDYQLNHPDAIFTLAINHLADRTPEEFNSPLGMSTVTYSSVLNKLHRSNNFPDSLDWRSKDVITPVDDIAHAPIVAQLVAVEMVESLHAIKNGSLEQGSMDRLVDCCPLDSNPFECIIKLEGICHLADYPYPTGQCEANRCRPFTRFNELRELLSTDENEMITWIQDSPLYSSVDASQITFLLYKGGIYQDSSCSSTVIGRKLQLVGYGKSDSGEPFWICKNSHGTQWGENGYIRVLRGKNMCGIATQVFQIA